MPFAEDLSPYFADFGDAGTLAGQPVRVIFDAPGSAAFGGDISATEPQVQIASASVPAAVVGAGLVIPQGVFIVRESVPDGSGMTLLLLALA